MDNTLLFATHYLLPLGFVLRLVRPDLVDKASTLFLKIMSPKKLIWNKYRLMFDLEKSGKINIYKDKKKKKRYGLFKRARQFNTYLKGEYVKEKIENNEAMPGCIWAEEQFPYYYGTLYVYKHYLPKELSSLIMKNKKYHNTNMYNYWKLLLAERNPNISSIIYQAEAHVRFMCGSFWALSFGLLSGIILSFTNLINPHSGSDIKTTFGVLLTLISGLMLGIILTRFKNQRRREVKLVLDGIIITTNGSEKLDFFRASGDLAK